MNDLKRIIKSQRRFFESKISYNLDFRLLQLKKLENSIKSNQINILNAAKGDLNKSSFEAYTNEVYAVISEIKYIRKNLKKWAKDEKVPTSIINFPAKSFIRKEAYGIVLLITPWNYPFRLAIMPLIASIAAGNCSIIKMSKHSKNTNKVLKKIIDETFDSRYVHLLNDEKGLNDRLLDEKYDFIFFTGSSETAKNVMRKAANNLTKLSLELGGKNPCIVDKTANIDIAAKRIVWGKLLNSAQTCIAADYIYVDEKIKDKFISRLIYYIEKHYKNQLTNPDYPKIINKSEFNRLESLIEDTNVIYGGDRDEKSLKFATTIVDNVSWDDKIMQKEIFGPIFPILTFRNISEVEKAINKFDKPLALYLFTKNKIVEKMIIKNLSFGGGCVNDCIMHINNRYLPFGGVGASGMGAYNGKYSYDSFTHKKSIMKMHPSFEIPLRYSPFRQKNKIVNILVRRVENLKNFREN